MEFKTFDRQAAQGDCLITRVDKLPNVNALPEGAEEVVAGADGRLVVAHSETGHHHFINKAEARFFKTPDPMVCYLVVDESATMLHDRSFDTHVPLKIPAGTYKMNRQREYTPDGWRQVQD